MEQPTSTLVKRMMEGEKGCQQVGFKLYRKIIEKVSQFNPASILDIGIGQSDVLLREKFELPNERYMKEDWKNQTDSLAS